MRTLHIQRALKNARLVYSFQGTQLSGQARCTGGFLLQKLSVRRADGVPGTWILAQKNWLLRLLACLPLLRLVIRVPFRLTHDGCLCAMIEKRAPVFCNAARPATRCGCTVTAPALCAGASGKLRNFSAAQKRGWSGGSIRSALTIALPRRSFRCLLCCVCSQIRHFIESTGG